MSHHRLLRKHGLFERVTYRVNVTTKEKEKEKVEEKEKEPTENKKHITSVAQLSDEEWNKKKTELQAGLMKKKKVIYAK